MANSNRMALYNDMSQHDNFGTFDQFNEALDYPDNMQAAYDFMKDKGDYGTFDDFAASMTRDDGAFELPNPAATAPVQTPEVAQTAVPVPDTSKAAGTDVMWQSDANPGWGADELPANDPEALANTPQGDYTGVTDTELEQANVAFNDKYKDTTEFNSLDEYEDYRKELGDVLDKDMELYSRQREADKLKQLNFDYSATDDADLKKIYEEADSLLTTAPNVTDRALAFAKRNSAAAEIGNRQRDEQAEKQAAQKAVTAAKTAGLDAQSQQNKANFERLFGADEKRQNEIAAEAVKREKKVYDNAVMAARQYTDEQLDKAINDTLATNGRGYEVQAAAVALLQEKQARTRGVHGKTVAESECDAIIDGTDNQRLVEYCTKWQMGDPGFDSTRESGFKDVPDIVIGEMFASMVDKSNLAANKQFEEELSTGIYQGSPAMAGLLMSQGARRIAANDYTTMLNTCIEKYGRDKLDAYIIEFARKNNIRVTDAANKVMGWITKATIGKLVDVAKPTSDAQYYALGILNGMFTTRVLGGLTRLASGVDYGNTTPLDVAELSMQEYRKGMTPNEQLISDITITTVPLIIDPTTFALPCQAGKMSGNLMLRTMGVNIADATAVRSAQKGALGLAQRLIGGAANFATFEIQMLPVEAMRTGTLNGKPLYDYVDDNGKQHKGLSAWEITKEFAKSGGKGAIGGAALAGTGLVAERLTRAWTGVGAYLGTALQLGVESSALTVNEYLFASDKEKAEFEWATKFAGSFAMVIGTKIWHAKDIVKDMKARAKGLYDPNVTMKNLSKEDADALTAKGYPTIAAILRGWNKETFKGIDRTACAEELGKMMSDKNVNWEQFRMAEWALEGVMMPAPLMADYQQERTGPGEYSITLVDKNGRAIGSPIIVKGTEGLKQARQKLNLEKEKNAVALGEDGLRQVAADANMTSDARAVAETINRNLPEGSEPLTADDVKNMVTAIVNKEGRGEELNTIEKEVKNDMLTMLNGTSMAFSGDLAIANLRAEMESKHGVKIAKAIRKPVSRRTDAEKAAIADYVEALKDFATGIKSGKTTTQLTQTDAKGAQKAADEIKKQDTDAEKDAEVEEAARPKAGTHGEVLDPDIAGMHPDEMAFFNKRPRRAVKLMNDMAKVLGVPIRLYNGVGDENGMFHEGVIWVNRNSNPKTAIGFIIGHEVTHHLKQSGNPALFDVFRDHAQLYMQSELSKGKIGADSSYKDYVDDLVKVYRDQYTRMYVEQGMTEEEAKAMAEKVFTEENAIEEITCDVAGKIFSDMTAARDILGSIHDRTRLERLKDAVMHTIESLGKWSGWTSDSRRRLIEMREPLRKLFDARLKAIKDEEERAKRDVSTPQPEAPKAEQPQRAINGRPADIDDAKKIFTDEDFETIEPEEIDRTIGMLERDRQQAHDYAEGRSDVQPYFYKHWAERDGLDTFGEEPAPKAEQPAPETAPPAPTTEQQVRSIVDELYKGASDADKQSLIDDVMADPRDTEAKLADLKEMLVSDGTNDGPSFSLRREPEPKETKKGVAVFVVKRDKNGKTKLVPKMLSNDPGSPPLTWLNADTGYLKRDENGVPLTNTIGRGAVSVSGTQGGGMKNNKLSWRPGKHLAVYPNASQFAGNDGMIPENVVFFEVEYAADPTLHTEYQRQAWEYGTNDKGDYNNTLGGLPYIPKDSYYIYRTNQIADGATPMIITGAYRITKALTDAEAREWNQSAGGKWVPRRGGELTEEGLRQLGLDEAGLERMRDEFDYSTIENGHDESEEARRLPGYVRRPINFDNENLRHAAKENGQNITDYIDGYEPPKRDAEPQDTPSDTILADAQARLNDPNASEFERQAAQAVIKAHSEDIARSPLNQEKDNNTGENLDDIEKLPNFAPRNTGILNIQQHEYTDDFKRVQAESERLVQENQPTLYQRGDRRFDESTRSSLAATLSRLLSNGNGSVFRQWVGLTGKGNQFRFAQVNGQLFHDIFEVNRRYLKNGELVDLHDNYDDAKCFISDDGLCGFAIEPSGNLVSVFSLNGGAKPGVLYAIRDFVREQGATHLDAYASKNQPLQKIYEKTLGFKTASEMEYNMEYDHDQIAANHGNPDVVFMVANDGQVEKRRFTKDQYDEAEAYQLSQIPAPRGNDRERAANQPKFSINNKEREQRRDSDESKRLFEATKQKFGTTNDIREAGYILPDGTMLDFSGRHWMDEGHDSSHLAGNRAVDHRNIYEVGYDKDENETGIETDMTDFISRGAIRVHRSGNYSRINLSMEPTPEQMRVLRRFASGVDNVDVDFGDGNTTEHFVEYNDAWPSRVVGDIDRYFTEGIKPQGTPQFSINPDKEVENVVVDSSRDKLPKTRKEAITMLDSMTQPFHNNDQDVDIFVSHRDADHTMSYRNQDQIKVIGAYGNLIANAVKIGEVPVKEKVKDTVKAIHIFYSPINIDGKQYSARMVVREYFQGKYIVDELHLYNTQLRKEKTDETHAQPQNGSPNVLSPVKSRYKISELIHSTQEEDLKLLGIGRDKPKFSLSRNDEDRPTFYSNAAHAVESVKQNKATAEQWKAMLTKAGGIKAGEDKWMGLSQWLDDHKGKPLTKEEVMQFVQDNGIEMREVNYGEGLDGMAIYDRYGLGEHKYGGESLHWTEWFDLFPDGIEFQGNPQERLELADIVNNKDHFVNKENYDFTIRGEEERYIQDTEKELFGFVVSQTTDGRPINSTRSRYTTPGLDNKREIAFVVPGVEPYQEFDDIHFGPENEGRAVMWVRFGETTDADGNRVLVIDEVQSNRHQDAREKGYRQNYAEAKALQDEKQKLQGQLRDITERVYERYTKNGGNSIEFYNEGWHKFATAEELQEYRDLTKRVNNISQAQVDVDPFYNKEERERIPAAPFEKNWHEVAMKRMLRLAAEEGFDKVAWTTGEQQSNRYGLADKIDRIEAHRWDGDDGSVSYELQTFDPNGRRIETASGLKTTEQVEEMFGKDLGGRIIGEADKGGTATINGEGLNIGGEGMKAFYDGILTNYMDKYCKKWGTRVGETTLNTPGRETMHSVDVTPEMKESVMQGQPLFSINHSDTESRFGRSVDPRLNGMRDRAAQSVEYERNRRWREGSSVPPQQRFDIADFSLRDRTQAASWYERQMQRASVQFTEAMQDSMMGLKKLMQAIAGHKKDMADIPGFENPYIAENRLSSTCQAQQHEYRINFYNPLLKAVHKLAGKSESERNELTRYMMAKHGIERNEVLARRDATQEFESDGNKDSNGNYIKSFPEILDKYRQRDYSGLTALTGKTDVADAEAEAAVIVNGYEARKGQADIDELWSRTKDATRETLDMLRRSELMDDDQFQRIADMFQFYIPLRGWDETTSNEVYGYLTSPQGPIHGNVMQRAKGRNSVADDPIATIAMMAEDAINQGNRNLVKTKLLNFVLMHPSDLVSVNDLWLQYNAANDEWVPVFADIDATDSPEVAKAKIDAFNERMEQLAANDPDNYKRQTEAANIPYKVLKANIGEHNVIVKWKGRTYVLTINGNPRAAQAVNGLTNPHNRGTDAIGRILTAAGSVNRTLSQLYTTRNPEFVLSNFVRDLLYSNTMAWVKENPKYAASFNWNFFTKVWYRMPSLIRKWNNGTLDRSNHIEDLFYKFMHNGGETGYGSAHDIERYKRELAKALKTESSAARRGWAALTQFLDMANRSAENTARFTAFVTSMENGRGVDRSIYDAKEVSVNFNKKGSGSKTVGLPGQTLTGNAAGLASDLGRSLYVFWNAGVQGLTNYTKPIKKHPVKWTAMASSLFALGFLQAWLNSEDKDESDNSYYDIPDYKRRSNIVFRGAGNAWVTLALAIEQRAFYGLGELAFCALSGNERFSNEQLAFKIAEQISQIFPIDVTEGGRVSGKAFIPTAAKPAVEAYANSSWTGLPIYKETPYNKDDPEYSKAYSSTDADLVNATQWLNDKTASADDDKGWINLNPARIEYMLKGYAGGYFTVYDRIKKMCDTFAGGRDFEWRNMLVASRFLTSGDERTKETRIRNEYFRYREEAEDAKRLLRKWKDDPERLNAFMETDKYKRSLIFNEEVKRIDDLRDALKVIEDEATANKVEADIAKAEADLVQRMHDFEDGKIKAPTPPKKTPEEEKKEEDNAIKENVRMLSKMYSSEQLDSAFNAETDSVKKAQYRLELMKDEGVKNPRGEQPGDSDAMKAYHKAQNDDDVRKDARISKVRTKLKPIKETFNKMGGEIHKDNFYPKKGTSAANVEKLQKYKDEHLDELEALRWLTVWDAYMKKYRARIAKGEDPEKVMNEVRESRTNLFKHLSKFIDQ